MKFIKKEHLLVPTKEVLNEIQKSIACKQPEQLAMLGSSDGKYIDIMFFIDKSKSTQTSCEPDIEVCNKKIREWYEKDIAFCGFAHSHPGAYSQLSDADIEYADRIMEAELSRVRAIVASKASVLKKALETDNLSIERKEDKICFPWFTDHDIDGEAKAYMQLVSGIAKRAKMLTRVTATESPSDNDKFTMRLFLVSLNFKGEEYKFARKFLLRNLSGNSSWRTEDAKARHDARKVQQEIEAPEVTVEQSSEGGESHAELSE